MPPTKEQSEWVARVLGFRPGDSPAASPHEALQASVASLIAKAGKLAGAPRPGGPPRQQTTEKLLNAMTASPAPEDPADVPAHVETFLSDFLVFVEAERPASSEKLGPGSPVPGPDQVLGIADLFAVTQRAMIEWETLLNGAETAESAIDLIEEQEEQRDETEYADSLTTYNGHRKQTIAAEEKALKLMAELQGAFNSLSESARTQALKEAGENG